MFKRLYLLVLLVGCSLLLTGQSPVSPYTMEQFRQEIVDRGITEQDLKQRLRDRGIELGSTPQELIQQRPIIESIIAELEAENAAAKREALESAAVATDEINEAVSDGASVEEAIGEVTSEAAAEVLPKSRIYGHNVFRNKSLARGKPNGLYPARQRGGLRGTP